MAKNLQNGHRFTTGLRGYSTATLEAVSIEEDKDHNELVITVRDHLGRYDKVSLNMYKEVRILNWGDK